MKEELVLAFNEVLDDRQLPKEVIVEALEAALISAYRKTVNASTAQEVRANLDLETGKITIYAEKEVVESIHDSRTEVLLEEARNVEPDAELGHVVVVETTPENFGRVAAQTARQVIQQRIREAEREAQYKFFHNQVGEIVNGIVQAANPHAITLGLDRKAEGFMPRNHQIRGERFRVHDRVRALLQEVKLTPRGPQITLSRAHRNFLRRLLEDEVPEIYHGLVEIRSIAREPGYRSKVAVSALQPGIDPVGACVGIRGVRIQAIVRELNDEKIDVIEWNPDPAAYIAKALSPARVTGVFLNESIEGTKTATVVVPEDQLSLAIGRDGQNARLAAKLTSWRIDIKSLPEAASEALLKLENHPDYAGEKEALAEIIPAVEISLTKKAERRPITPEEYQMLGKFVNEVERGASERRQLVVETEKARIAEAHESIPETAFDIILDDLGLTPSLNLKLTGVGYSTIGDLMLELNLDPDKILALNGIGPKTLEIIDQALAEFDFPEVEVEEEQEAEADVEAEGEPVEQPSEGEEAVDGEITEVAAELETPDQAKPEETEAEETASIDEVFAQSIEELTDSTAIDTQVEDAKQKDVKKKKKKKYREIEYDPDRDVTIVTHKRKRDTDDWESDDWDEE
ncbi:MAG: transcription termination/antitermination protein NusA [Chloroflexi bacterium]|nr:transcription termination/antitermination protein NusA [Chloroflexota bacterium]